MAVIQAARVDVVWVGGDGWTPQRAIALVQSTARPCSRGRSVKRVATVILSYKY